MDYYTASKVLEEIMSDTYLEEEQVEAMETAIQLLHAQAGREDDDIR